MIFYNYFENITDKFKLTIQNKTHEVILLILKMVVIILQIFQKL